MDVQENIRKILDDDEIVLCQLKPNKKRFILLSALSLLLALLIFVVLFFVLGLGGIIGFIKYTNEAGERELLAPIMFIVFASAPIIFLLVRVFSLFPIYKNTFYIVTNKRIIIRGGFIGVDYKSLALKNIIAVDVRVDFLDKLVNPNSGTIIFGSPANQMSQDKNNKNSAYMFAHIDNPYDEYKEIKSIIDREVEK